MTIPVKDANNATVNVPLPLAPGRAAAAVSKPIVLATEDLAALTLVSTRVQSLIDLFAAVDDDQPRQKIVPIASNPLLTEKIAQVGATTTVVLVNPGVAEKGAVYELHLQVSNFAADCLITFRVNAVAVRYVKCDAGAAQVNIDWSFRGYDYLHSGAADQTIDFTISSIADVFGDWDYTQSATA